MEPWTLVAIVAIVAFASLPAEEVETKKENVICIASTCHVNNENETPEEHKEENQ